eukprot:6473499-Pyramimonas_sp.AAC.2
MLPPSHAITEENLIYLEAWRAVDKAYVDKTFNGQSCAEEGNSIVPLASCLRFRVKEKTLKNVPMEDRDETYDAIRALVQVKLVLTEDACLVCSNAGFLKRPIHPLLGAIQVRLRPMLSLLSGCTPQFDAHHKPYRLRTPDLPLI